jgi:hypothetical protein
LAFAWRRANAKPQAAQPLSNLALNQCVFANIETTPTILHTFRADSPWHFLCLLLL